MYNIILQFAYYMIYILKFLRASYNQFVWFFYYKKQIITVTDPVTEYIQKRTRAFLNVFTSVHSAPETLSDISLNSSDPDYNSNIEKIVYSKPDFFETLSFPGNSLEHIWKKRILIENTPRGNIYMYYDIFKQGFAYYSDQTGVPYRILNAVAMKYVVTFRCVDFFLDENTMPEGKTSPLIKIFIDDDEDEKKKKRAKMEALDINLKGAPFAKFKTYEKDIKKLNNNMVTYGNTVKKTFGFRYWVNQWFGWITRIFSQKMIEVLPKTLENLPIPSIIPVKKDKIINKFIFLGHTKNFRPLQIPVCTKPVVGGFSTQYDTMFSKNQKISYKDYKAQNTPILRAPSFSSLSDC